MNQGAPFPPFVFVGEPTSGICFVFFGLIDLFLVKPMIYIKVTLRDLTNIADTWKKGAPD